MSKPLVVYWCTNATEDKQGIFSLLELEPKPVFPEIVTNTVSPPRSYRQCTGLKRGTQNLYYVKFPVDFSFSLHFNESTNSVEASGVNSEWVLPRNNTYNNSFAFDLDLGWVFFSEESLTIKQTPPFSHRTVASSYGRPAMGAFDIGAWFRPVSPAWTLWEGINEFQMPRDEPAMYLEFYTERRIIFKHFFANDILRSLWTGCAKNPIYLPNLSLEERYSIFAKRNLRKKVLAEIKKNLLD